MPEPGDPPFPVEPATLAVLHELWSAGHGAYLVGGGVRDALLGLAVGDWDVTTDARPERILALFPGSTYQNRFGTVLARGHEVTTFRRDHRYADHRRPDSVTFSQDVYEDLARRDFTINAIAWGAPGPEAGTRLVDPADGRRDLEARVVRAVGDPDRRFEEDALRLLRAVRIAARLGFDIEPVTAAAMRVRAADMAWVSEERIGMEVRRMLADAPGRALELLADTDLLATTLPELAGLPADGLQRTQAMLEAVAAAHAGNERLALAALLAEAGPASARACLVRLRLRTREAGAVAVVLAAADVPAGGIPSEEDVRRFLAAIPDELIDDALALRLARARVKEGQGDAGDGGLAAELELADRVSRQREAGVPLRLADLAVDGSDLRAALELPEGPIIGTLLERLLAAVIEEPSRNEPATLLGLAREVLAEEALASEAPTPPAEPPDGVGSGP